MHSVCQETANGSVIEICQEDYNDNIRLLIDEESIGLGALLTRDQCLELEQKPKAIREAKPWNAP